MNKKRYFGHVFFRAQYSCLVDGGVLPPGIAGLCCQKCSLAAKLNPQASQSRDRVVLTTDAGLSRSSMEPYFQNPHLDYQISVLPLPPEVTCQLDIKYAGQGAGRYMFLASH